MGAPLRVLCIEDSEDDTLLMMEQLRRSGYITEWERVETPEAAQEALSKQEWDAIVCDYSMPHFSMFGALALLQRMGLDIPFIIVSGTIGEEVAVAAMKAGAHDYLMKDNLTRLAPAIDREIREAEVRRRRREAEEERARLLVAEKKARQAAEDANRVKDEFLAVLSHELRTPLTSIHGWVALLKSGRLSVEDATRALSIIERNVRSEARLIDELLDMSRIMTGKLGVCFEDIDLAAVVQGAIEMIRLAASAKSIQLDIDLPQALHISGDPGRLQQVVWNLLNNAVKFTPNAGRVTIRLEQPEKGARIVIQDTGIGISPQFLPHVFEGFRQADMSTTRTHGGLGVGLGIVRSLVGLHGGTVSITSEGEGQGTTCVVVLPQSPLPAGAPKLKAPAAAEKCALPSGKLDGVSALVAEDDADTRELIVRVLQQYGAQVASADSSAAALKTLEHCKPNILIADLGMPGEDGYSLLRKVRARGDALSRIPAVAVTAYVKSEDRARALSAGFQAHVPKPIDMDSFITTVSNACQTTVSA